MALLTGSNYPLKPPTPDAYVGNPPERKHCSNCAWSSNNHFSHESHCEYAFKNNNSPCPTCYRSHRDAPIITPKAKSPIEQRKEEYNNDRCDIHKMVTKYCHNCKDGPSYCCINGECFASNGLPNFTPKEVPIEKLCLTCEFSGSNPKNHVLCQDQDRARFNRCLGKSEWVLRGSVKDEPKDTPPKDVSSGAIYDKVKAAGLLHPIEHYGKWQSNDTPIREPTVFDELKARKEEIDEAHIKLATLGQKEIDKLMELIPTLQLFDFPPLKLTILGHMYLIQPANLFIYSDIYDGINNDSQTTKYLHDGPIIYNAIIKHLKKYLGKEYNDIKKKLKKYSTKYCHKCGQKVRG